MTWEAAMVSEARVPKDLVFMVEAAKYFISWTPVKVQS